METQKTLGQVLREEVTRGEAAEWWQDMDPNARARYEHIAAAVVQAHEAAQLMTWDEAMEWATEGGACRYVLGYWPERKMWFMISPETDYNCNSGRSRFTGSFTDGHRHVWSPGELTHFRRLPEPPKEGR